MTRLMRIAFTLFLMFTAPQTNAQSLTSAPYYSDPAISPDGIEVAFVTGGDIWTAPSDGGEARLLIAHPATESRPVYSPDGSTIAFNSSRTGNGDVYTMNMLTGKVTRLTYDDGADEVSSWSKDGKYVYFGSTSRDISGMRDVFRIKASGGTPMPVSDNRYVSEYHPSPSPDGKSTAIIARGIGWNQWWRNGRSHLDESEIWLMKDGASPTYTKLAERGAKQLWPMWAKDGQTLYYISDRSGKENLWSMPVNGTPKQLTNFKTGRMLWPSMSGNGDNIVFERDFAIWNYDVRKNESKKINIKLRGAPSSPSIDRMRMNSGYSKLALSHDGKKMAFIAHGEVFVASAKDGGEATRVTTTGASESDIAWDLKSNIIYFISERDGNAHLYQYNFISNKEMKITSGAFDDSAPLLSPDGKTISFIRDGKELRLFDIESKKERLLTKGYLQFGPYTSSGTISWSPDSKWLAFAGIGSKSLRNISVVSIASGEPKPVSFLANTFGGRVIWSNDGKSIFFTTSQRTENAYVAKISLVPQQPRFREDQFRDLFSEPTPPAPMEKTVAAKKDSATDSTLKSITAAKSKQPVRIVWEGISQRLSLLPLAANINDILISKDGNTLYLTTSVAGQTNIYSYSLDELSREPAVMKQLTSTAGNKTDLQLSPDGKEIFYVEGERIQSVSTDSRQTKPLSVSAEMDVDFSQEKMVVFNQAWDIQNKAFYDENYHGQNWNEIKKTYAPYAAGAQTPDELRRILNLMVGELNASHSGVSGSTPPTFSTGRIGLRFDRRMYEDDGKLKITEVIALGPAALSDKINIGDMLVAIDGKRINVNDNLDQLLDNKINKRLTLTISGTGGNEKEVIIRPMSLGTEKGLLYKQWVQQQRNYVSRISNGRLGYVHMFDMGQGSLDQLYLDMDADNHAREGVVVDVRNNNGGFVNAYALDVLSRKGYLSMTARGLPTAPGRVQLGQRALDAPTILVTNQHSLSDAEDFTEGYRSLGLGKVVGEPTAGWIIFTGGTNLIDGSSIRLPFIKITDNKGQNMELAPRPVDIAVENPLGENNKDAQLDTAVKELLKQVDTAKKTENR